MKKFFLSLLLAVMAIGASAQVTYNARVGFGAGTDQYGEDMEPMGTLQIQSNIPFKKGSPLTFSPSVVVSANKAAHLYVPLTIGYKIPMNDTWMFFPKAGLAFGIEGVKSNSIAGPTVGLDFEIKHFVIGLNGYISGDTFEDEKYSYPSHYYTIGNHSGVNLTVGYKF